MSKRVLEIDGSGFDSLEGFFQEVSARVVSEPWGENLDAFNDILRGGFGTPEGGFVLRWVNSERSRQALGYPKTARYLEEILRRCHPANTASVTAKLKKARAGEGDTLFDILVEIFRVHGPGGREEQDGVDLELA